jgi:hypothetical protein
MHIFKTLMSMAALIINYQISISVLGVEYGVLGRAVSEPRLA